MTNSKNTIVAVFNQVETARQAQAALIQSGIPQSDIKITSNENSQVRTAASGSTSEHEGGISGFFHRMFGAGDESDRGYYTEAVQRGGAVLTVDADGDYTDSATEILNRYDPSDIDETSSAASSRAESLTNSGERTIPVVQEELQVGKRSVQRGGVRVYSRITETPVEEKVTLREEHARVERRTVDRAATEADFRPNQVVEVVETSEEAVVGKTARVVEEVVVGKQTSNRTETVRDSVRRTDVEVEQISPEVRQDFKRDFATRYGSEANADYDAYEPAYGYGYTMANNPQYQGKNWSDVESNLRTDYSKSNPGSSWIR